MPPKAFYTLKRHVQEIYDYYKLIDGLYRALSEDKIIVWYSYDSLQSMLDVVKGLELEYSTGTIKHLDDVLKGFNNYITSIEHFNECKVVNSKVDNILYTTKIKEVKLYNHHVSIHMVIHEEPKVHPIYGEYVGWSTQIVSI